MISHLIEGKITPSLPPMTIPKVKPPDLIYDIGWYLRIVIRDYNSCRHKVRLEIG